MPYLINSGLIHKIWTLKFGFYNFVKWLVRICLFVHSQRIAQSVYVVERSIAITIINRGFVLDWLCNLNKELIDVS